MAINIRHTYSTDVEIFYYTEDGYIIGCRSCGQMDNIAEQVGETLVKHNFSCAEVCSAETGEVLIEIERT